MTRIFYILPDIAVVAAVSDKAAGEDEDECPHCTLRRVPFKVEQYEEQPVNSERTVHLLDNFTEILHRNFFTT